MLGKGFEDAPDSCVDCCVGKHLVGNVYKRDIDPFAGRKRVAVMPETESLAYASAHFHPVDGVVKPFFGYGNQESYRRVRTATTVAPCDDTQRIAQMRKIGYARGKEQFNGAGGTQFLFLI